tara:strand:- start:2457 stop:4109 length:1653 start_codon:yes stop_codon:yes gene_type:complete
VLILAAALTPILLVAAMQAYLDGRENLNTRRDALLQNSDRSIDDVEQNLITAEALLEIFSEQIAAGRCSDVRTWLQPQIPALTNVAFFDADGESKCSAAGTAGYSMFNPEWNEQLKNGEVTIRSDAFFGPGSQKWIFAIYRRLEYNGEFVGSAAFGLSAETLARGFADNNPDEDLSMALVDINGTAFGELPPFTIEPDWLERARNSERGVLFVENDAAGVNYDIVITPIGLGKLYTVVTRPSPGLFDELTLKPATTVGLPLIAFSFALAAAWVAIDKLVLRWLARLRRLAQAYGRGDYEVKPDDEFLNAPEEIAALANSMDRMSVQIGKRDDDLKEAIMERDAALKEIHHRVKNNLQLVISFLNLQSRRLTDAEGRAAINATRLRIDALSVVHQTLYQYNDLDIVHLKPFFDSLLHHLSNALGLEDSGVELTHEVIDLPWRADDAIPLALFVVEAITNSAKYAFDDDGGRITVTLMESEGGVELTIRDDGAGKDLPVGGKSLAAGDGLGSQLMNAFVKQLNGRLNLSSSIGHGYTAILFVPRERYARDGE